VTILFFLASGKTVQFFHFPLLILWG
jgi:hypothetical protein